MLVAPLLAAGAVLPSPARGAAMHSARSWQRLRGGTASDGTVLKLSTQEITEKLNHVPAFCVMQADGSVISLPDPDGVAEGDECCTWFLDGAEAEYTLKRVVAANPDLGGLHLQSFGLGDAFTMCDGWPREVGAEKPAAGGESSSALKLQAKRAVVKQCEAQLIDALRRQGDVQLRQSPVVKFEALY